MRLSLPGIGVSVALHLGLAAFVISGHSQQSTKRGSSVVDIEIVQPAPPPEPVEVPEVKPEPPPEPIEPPPPRRVRKMKVKKVAKATLPVPEANQTPEAAPPAPEPAAPPPPAEPAPLPVFALDMEATVSTGSGISVRAEVGGGSAYADPDATRDLPTNGNRGPAAGTSRPLAAAEVLEITRMPRCPQPDVRYPVEARREGREGEVELRLVIDAAGRVASAEVTRSAGSIFDTAALEAARRIRCSPGRMGAVAAAVPIPYTIGFVLEG